MPDYQHWPLVDEFTLHQAACLWCDVIPGASPLFTRIEHPDIIAIEQMLEAAIRNDELAANTDDVSPLLKDYSKARIRRRDLQVFAERKGVKPKFLFSEERSMDGDTEKSTAAAEQEYRRWIEGKIAAGYRRDNRDALFPEARTEIPGLARRAFDRTWTAAAPDERRADLRVKPTTPEAAGTTVSRRTEGIEGSLAKEAADAPRLGRPSYADDIREAYESLRDDGKVDFAAPKNRLYGPIRAIVQERRKLGQNDKGLRGEAIRKAIANLFEVDRERQASP